MRKICGLVTVLFILTVLLTACNGAASRGEAEKYPGSDHGIVKVELSPNATRLMNYLSDNYGKKILSGQQDTSWTMNTGIDMTARVFEDTGKYPAVKGFDFLDLRAEWMAYGRQQLEEAIEWWEGKNQNNGDPVEALLPNQPDIHGIVTFCWHWKVGDAHDFYTNNTDFRIPWKNGKLDTASPEFKDVIIADLDAIAALLQEMKDMDIPVLWRPLHEAVGNYYGHWEGANAWFWWGASGPEPYMALWEYMYNYLSYVKGLNNLIWVWNAQHKDWFPNPDTVHIIGYDVYAGRKDYNSQAAKYLEAKQMAPDQNLMVAMTENGQIPDPRKCMDDGAMWSWFCTWNDAVGMPGNSHNDNFWTGENNNTLEHRRYVYDHDLVITLDELPDLTKYRLD